MTNLERYTLEREDSPDISTGKVFREKFKNIVCIAAGVAIMACSGTANALPPNSPANPNKLKNPSAQVDPPKKKVNSPKKKTAEVNTSIEFNFEEHGNLSGPEIKERLQKGADASRDIGKTNNILTKLKSGENLNPKEKEALISITEKYGANAPLLKKLLDKDILDAEDYMAIKAEIKKIFEGQLKAIKYHIKLRTWLLTIMSLSDSAFSTNVEKDRWIMSCVDKIRTFKILEVELEKTIASM